MGFAWTDERVEVLQCSRHRRSKGDRRNYATVTSQLRIPSLTPSQLSRIQESLLNIRILSVCRRLIGSNPNQSHLTAGLGPSNNKWRRTPTDRG